MASGLEDMPQSVGLPGRQAHHLPVAGGLPQKSERRVNSATFRLSQPTKRPRLLCRLGVGRWESGVEPPPRSAPATPRNGSCTVIVVP